MQVYGIDLTSAPSRAKPICVAVARLDSDRLACTHVHGLRTLDAFESALREPGPWIAGFDFPFTQSRTFLRNMGWPEDWPAFARLLGGLTRTEFRERLVAYRTPRPPGDKEHSREFEKGTGAVSPQKLDRVPVALMQHVGAPRLLAAGVQIPGLAEGDPSRIAVEAYPGVAARALIGKASYKSEDRARQTPARRAARDLILARLTGAEGRVRFGLSVSAPPRLAEDPGGDPLDALLCAVQAAWAWRLMTREPDRFAALDLTGGWIADPAVVDRLPTRA